MAIQIHLNDVNLNLRVREDGMRLLALVDPQSGISVHVAMPEEAARQLADSLAGSNLIVAQPYALHDLLNGKGGQG